MAEQQLVDFDKQIQQLVTSSGITTSTALIKDMVRTSLGLGRDGLSTLDLKIANSVLKELREAFQMMTPFARRKKVTIFGSARTTKDDPVYLQTAQVASRMADENWMVVTGAGPGIMEAGMEGAGRDRSIGVSIRLPFETSANSIIAGDDKHVSMKYFFTRKLMLVKESQAFIYMPGGFGTLDEMFELLTLAQTGKSTPAPIVLLDLPHDRFWHRIDEFISDQLIPRNLVSETDRAFYHLSSNVEDAVQEICGFYANYESMRQIGKQLVIRHRVAISDEQLGELNREFSHLTSEGQIERTEALSVEVAEQDSLDFKRLRLRFIRNNFSELRRLINRLNSFVPVG
ncbi:MAG: TIGR00730 family Rossman fold protein [Ilumatobacteraceae bacterium]